MTSTRHPIHARIWTPIAFGVVSSLISIGLYLSSYSSLMLLWIAILCNLSWSWLAYLVRDRDLTALSGLSDHPLDLPLSIARDDAIFQQYLQISKSLLQVSQIPDPVFRQAALGKIHSANSTLKQVANGTLVFECTETWRLVYEALLQSPTVFLYRSVSWVKHENYWQDEPGRNSMKIVFQLVDQQRLNMERIVIIADSLWPDDERLPTERILRWIEAHQLRGIWIKLIRESTVANEPDLLVDFGIYGSHAVGEQFLDEECKTVRYELKFNFAEVETAEQRWNRLSVYSTSYKDLLERPP